MGVLGYFNQNHNIWIPVLGLRHPEHSPELQLLKIARKEKQRSKAHFVERIWVDFQSKFDPWLFQPILFEP